MILTSFFAASHCARSAREGYAVNLFGPDASWISQPRIDELTRLGKAEKYWPISPDIIIEVKSDSDEFTDTIAHAKHFRKRGTIYAVAIDPDTREVVELGTAPEGLTLDFDAIIDA